MGLYAITTLVRVDDDEAITYDECAARIKRHLERLAEGIVDGTVDIGDAFDIDPKKDRLDDYKPGSWEHFDICTSPSGHPGECWETVR